MLLSSKPVRVFLRPPRALNNSRFLSKSQKTDIGDPQNLRPVCPSICPSEPRSAVGVCGVNLGAPSLPLRDRLLSALCLHLT